MSYEEEEEDNAFIQMVSRNHQMFKNRNMTFYSKQGKNIVATILPTIPDNIIVCDGCNDLIKDEEVGLLMLEENHVWGTQCKKCISKYYSELSVVNHI